MTVERLGWTLVHFVWQGMIVWACLSIVLWWMRRSSAHARYLVACAGFGLMVGLPILTFAVIHVDRNGVQHTVGVGHEHASSSSIPVPDAPQPARSLVSSGFDRARHPVNTMRVQRVLAEPLKATDESDTKEDVGRMTALGMEVATSVRASDDALARIPSSTDSRQLWG